MSVKKRRFSIVIIAGLVVVLAGWLLAVGDGALAAQAAIRQRPKPAAATVHGPVPTAVPVVQPTSLQVAYRLDPWMLSGNYGSDFWASPASLGPTTQSGKNFVVEARVAGFANGGTPITDAQWASSDPSLVRVTPSGRAHNMNITVAREGQSSVHVSAGGLSKDLVITAEANASGGLLVKIAQ
jgi:hypothetical protein